MIMKFARVLAMLSILASLFVLGSSSASAQADQKPQPATRGPMQDDAAAENDDEMFLLSSCNPKSTGWGYGDVCQGSGGRWHGYVDDTQSDGHCVNAEYNTYAGGPWNFIVQSCGPATGFEVYNVYQIRMVRTGYPWPWVYLWTP